MQSLQANGAEEVAMKQLEELQALQSEFITQYTVLLQTKEKSRDEHRKTPANAKFFKPRWTFLRTTIRSLSK